MVSAASVIGSLDPHSMEAGSPLTLEPTNRRVSVATIGKVNYLKHEGEGGPVCHAKFPQAEGG